MVKYELGIIADGEFRVTDNNPTHCHHYSDEDFTIIQEGTNAEYDDAIDVLPCRYTYKESSNKIMRPDDNPEVIDSQETSESDSNN